MGLILRLVKGTPLTFAEGDANLTYLEDLITGSNNLFSNWTGSTTSIFAGTSSYALNVPATASYAIQTISASYALSASWAPNSLIGGTTNYVPLWINATTLTSSQIYQTTSSNIIIGGTTDSGYKLDVIGTSDSRISSVLIGDSGGSGYRTIRGNIASAFWLSNSLGPLWVQGKSYIKTLYNDASGYFSVASSGLPLQYIRIDLNSINTNNGYGLNYGLTIGADNTNAMKIATGGNIILQTGGTYTDAGYKLDVQGSTRITKELVVNDGTTTASYPLIVTSNITSGYAALFKHPSTYNTQIGISPTAIVFANESLSPLSISATVSAWDFVAPLDNLITFRTGGTSNYNIIQLSKNGVLINPTTTSSMDLRVYGDNDINLLHVDVSADNIGIGKSNPTYKLDVNGITNISGSLIVTGSVNIMSGSVTMPNRPAFRVIGSGSTDITGIKILSGSLVSVDYNQGNAYDNTTGLFTAPVAGLYHVYMNIRCGSVNSQQQVIMIKNAGTSVLMWESATNTGPQHFGVSGIVNLAVNDTLKVQVQIGNIQFDGNDSWGAAYIG